jgi:hypothetical protein
MKVRELIELLKTTDPEIPVVMWDADEDEWVEVVDGIYEDGTVHFALSSTDLGPKIPVPPEDLWPSKGDGA